MELTALTKQELALLSLTALALIGSIDEYFYHYKSERLLFKPECFKENILHAIRTLIYTILFFTISTYEVSGIFAVLLFGVFFIDLIVGILDILVENESRENMGGLPKGEYLIHMLLSFHLGILYYNFTPYLISQMAKPDRIDLIQNQTFPELNLFLKYGSCFTLIYFITQVALIWKAPRNAHK